MKDHSPLLTCSVCGRSLPASELVPFEVVRSPISEILRRNRPGWAEGDLICLEIQQVQMELMEEIASHRRSVEPEGLEGGPE